MTRILVLQHGADAPPALVGEWLTAAGAELDVRRLFAGDELPVAVDGFGGVLSLGGAMAAWEDDVAPWLPAVRSLLSEAVRQELPTLGICLGGQLLAAATGGSVRRGADGPEIGAYLTAKRDAADNDSLFGPVPMTPDVMHYHYDVVDRLPPGSTLLLSSAGYPHQAFRVGAAAWGLQFHIETTAALLREWAEAERIAPTARLGALLDEAQAAMLEVWQPFIARFVGLADQAAARPASDGHRNRPAARLVGRRIELSSPDSAPEGSS